MTQTTSSSSAGPSPIHSRPDPRPILDASRRTDGVTQRISDFHADVIKEIKARIESDAVVLVGMAQNPHVKKARTALDEAGIPFTYLEYGNYLKGWRPRLAVKLWSGWPTFPQVFVKGVLLGGNAETRAALADGSLKGRLETK